MDLPTYTNIWRIEKKLYKLYDFRLPQPVSVVYIGVVVGVGFVWVMLLRLLGVPLEMPLHVLYIVPPFVIAFLATRPVVEGKRLSELISSQARFLAEPRVYTRLRPEHEPSTVEVTVRVWHRHPQAGPLPAVTGSAALVRGRARSHGSARGAQPERPRGVEPPRRTAQQAPSLAEALPAAPQRLPSAQESGPEPLWGADTGTAAARRSAGEHAAITGNGHRGPGQEEPPEYGAHEWVRAFREGEAVDDPGDGGRGNGRVEHTEDGGPLRSAAGLDAVIAEPAEASAPGAASDERDRDTGTPWRGGDSGVERAGDTAAARDASFGAGYAPDSGAAGARPDVADVGDAERAEEHAAEAHTAAGPAPHGDPEPLDPRREWEWDYGRDRAIPRPGVGLRLLNYFGFALDKTPAREEPQTGGRGRSSRSRGRGTGPIPGAARTPDQLADHLAAAEGRGSGPHGDRSAGRNRSERERADAGTAARDAQAAPAPAEGARAAAPWAPAASGRAREQRPRTALWEAAAEAALPPGAEQPVPDAEEQPSADDAPYAPGATPRSRAEEMMAAPLPAEPRPGAEPDRARGTAEPAQDQVPPRSAVPQGAREPAAPAGGPQRRLRGRAQSMAVARRLESERSAEGVSEGAAASGESEPALERARAPRHEEAAQPPEAAGRPSLRERRAERRPHAAPWDLPIPLDRAESESPDNGTEESGAGAAGGAGPRRERDARSAPAAPDERQGTASTENGAGASGRGGFAEVPRPLAEAEAERHAGAGSESVAANERASGPVPDAAPDGAEQRPAGASGTGAEHHDPASREQSSAVAAERSATPVSPPAPDGASAAGKPALQLDHGTGEHESLSDVVPADAAPSRQPGPGAERGDGTAGPAGRESAATAGSGAGGQRPTAYAQTVGAAESAAGDAGADSAQPHGKPALQLDHGTGEHESLSDVARADAAPSRQPGPGAERGGDRVESAVGESAPADARGAGEQQPHSPTAGTAGTAESEGGSSDPAHVQAAPARPDRGTREHESAPEAASASGAPLAGGSGRSARSDREAEAEAGASPDAHPAADRSASPNADADGGVAASDPASPAPGSGTASSRPADSDRADRSAPARASGAADSGDAAETEDRPSGEPQPPRGSDEDDRLAVLDKYLSRADTPPPKQPRFAEAGGTSPRRPVAWFTDADEPRGNAGDRHRGDPAAAGEREAASWSGETGRDAAGRPAAEDGGERSAEAAASGRSGHQDGSDEAGRERRGADPAQRTGRGSAGGRPDGRERADVVGGDAGSAAEPQESELWSRDGGRSATAPPAVTESAGQGGSPQAGEGAEAASATDAEHEPRSTASEEQRDTADRGRRPQPASADVGAAPSAADSARDTDSAGSDSDRERADGETAADDRTGASAAGGSAATGGPRAAEGDGRGSADRPEHGVPRVGAGQDAAPAAARSPVGAVDRGSTGGRGADPARDHAPTPTDDGRPPEPHASEHGAASEDGRAAAPAAAAPAPDSADQRDETADAASAVVVPGKPPLELDHGTGEHKSFGQVDAPQRRTTAADLEAAEAAAIRARRNRTRHGDGSAPADRSDVADEPAADRSADHRSADERVAGAAHSRADAPAAADRSGRLSRAIRAASSDGAAPAAEEDTGPADTTGPADDHGAPDPDDTRQDPAPEHGGTTGTAPPVDRRIGTAPAARVDDGVFARVAQNARRISHLFGQTPPGTAPEPASRAGSAESGTAGPHPPQVGGHPAERRQSAAESAATGATGGTGADATDADTDTDTDTDKPELQLDHGTGEQRGLHRPTGGTSAHRGRSADTAGTAVPADTGATRGWRRLARVVTGGSPAAAKTDLPAGDIERLRTPVNGPRNLVVLGCTGGAGQTVTGLMLGHTLAAYRDERVVAVDVNPGGGGLSRRIRSETPETLTSLLANADAVHGYMGMRRYTSRTATGLEIVATLDDPYVQTLDDRDYAGLAGLLERFYEVTVLDPAATGVARALPVADGMVLVAPASEDAARAVAMTFEWLDGHGYAALRSTAVVVINGVSKRSLADVDAAEQVARGRCRAIVRVPWDDHLAAGKVVDVNALRATTRRAHAALGGVLMHGLDGAAPSGPPSPGSGQRQGSEARR